MKRSNHDHFTFAPNVVFSMLQPTVVVPVPRSLGTDLDGDGYVDGFEYVDCRRAIPEQFGVARSFTLPEPDPVVSTEKSACMG